ncbi:MAG: TatD family hydrolase [Bacillota bacterium]
MLFDSHAHLNDREFQGKVPGVVERAVEAGVNHITCVGYSLNSSRRSVELSRQYHQIYAAIGVHPHDARTYTEAMEKEFISLAREDKVVAIGETGLDYYRNLSPHDVQEDVFRRHIYMAKKADLPLIIHDREAHRDTVRILQEEKANEVGGIIHCFSGSWDMARQCLDMNFYISLAGPVTYQNAVQLQEIARLVPLDRLLVETDCPYLTPHPYRGKKNEPAYVLYVAEAIARIRRIAASELADITTENALRVYRIETS